MELARVNAISNADQDGLRLKQIELDLLSRGITLTQIERDEIEAKIDAIRRATEARKEEQFVQEQINNLVNTAGLQVSGLFENLINGTNSWNDALRNVFKTLSSTLFRTGLQLLGGGDGRGFFSILSGNFTGKAQGGPVMGRQPYMVGERGPELFVPGHSGRIIPNHMIDLGGKFLPFHPLFLAAMSGVGRFNGNRQAFMESFGARFGGMYGAQPRANGGPVSAGSKYLVGERGPEMFVPRGGGGGGGGVQVGAINITVQNTGEQLSPAAQKQLANQVQGIVMSTLVNERRSGGVLR